MNFLNNWSQAITLAPGVYSLALDLPDGDYRLTLADSAPAATRWEIIDAAVTDGVADLIRGQEGTVEQDWPEGSVIYCSLTAGVLSGMLSRIDTLETTVAELSSRVAILEGVVITSPGSGTIWGFSPAFGVGSISPEGATVYPDGRLGGNGQILELAWGDDNPYWGNLELRVSGGFDVWPDVASLPFNTMTVGASTFNRADLLISGYGDGTTVFAWTSVSPNPFAAGPNKITFS